MVLMWRFWWIFNCYTGGSFVSHTVGAPTFGPPHPPFFLPLSPLFLSPSGRQEQGGGQTRGGVAAPPSPNPTRTPASAPGPGDRDALGRARGKKRGRRGTRGGGQTRFGYPRWGPWRRGAGRGKNRPPFPRPFPPRPPRPPRPRVTPPPAASPPRHHAASAGADSSSPRPSRHLPCTAPLVSRFSRWVPCRPPAPFPREREEKGGGEEGARRGERRTVVPKTIFRFFENPLFFLI